MIAFNPVSSAQWDELLIRESAHEVHNNLKEFNSNVEGQCVSF